MNLEEVKEAILKEFDKEVVEAVENSDVLRCACELASAVSEEPFFDELKKELIFALRETVSSAGNSYIMMRKIVDKPYHFYSDVCRIGVLVHNYRACLFANLAVLLILRAKKMHRLLYVSMMKESHCPEDILNAALVEMRNHEKTTF